MSRFLGVRENNLKYAGIDALTRLVRIDPKHAQVGGRGWGGWRGAGEGRGGLHGGCALSPHPGPHTHLTPPPPPSPPPPHHHTTTTTAKGSHPVLSFPPPPPAPAPGPPAGCGGLPAVCRRHAEAQDAGPAVQDGGAQQHRGVCVGGAWWGCVPDGCAGCLCWGGVCTLVEGAASPRARRWAPPRQHICPAPARPPSPRAVVGALAHTTHVHTHHPRLRPAPHRHCARPPPAGDCGGGAQLPAGGRRRGGAPRRRALAVRPG